MDPPPGRLHPLHHPAQAKPTSVLRPEPHSVVLDLKAKPPWMAAQANHDPARLRVALHVRERLL